MDLLTFGLAVAAYALLGTDVASRAWGRQRRPLTVLVAVVLIAHVGLVWGHRFGWSVDTALAKGLAGFVIFHAAFAAILAAAVVREPWATRLLYAAFPVASVGAIGAAFRYDFVHVWRIPLLLVLGATIAAAFGAYRRRWAARGA